MQTSSRFPLCMAMLTLAFAAPAVAQQVDAPVSEQARQGLIKACDFFRTEVAVSGGYVYYCSPDLQTRLGEGPASRTQIWVQPPGTPTVGMQFLNAYKATGEPRFLEAARDAGRALGYGQLKSGAWTNSIDFDPKGKTAAYRNGRGKGRNFSTLDDGISQAAIQFLVKLDEATGFRNRQIHSSAQIALEALLKAQFTNGGFPQGWDDDSNNQRPNAAASFPDYNWKTEGRIKNYWDMATLNDGVAGTITETLLVAHLAYERDVPGDQQRYLAALRRFGSFLMAAQLPEPQPAWAQQYNDQLQPIWARRFEPPAVAGRETQDVIAALIRIAEATNDSSYLAPIPAALKWLRQSELTDGRLARYYELQSNRPLYMSRSGKQYALTYDDRNLPDHYGWKVENQVEDLEKALRRVQGGEPSAETNVPSDREVRKVLAELDDRGRWITTFAGEPLPGQPRFREGERYISSQVFADRVQLLSSYLR